MYGEGGGDDDERFLCCPFVDFSDAYNKAEVDDDDGEIVVAI